MTSPAVLDHERRTLAAVIGAERVTALYQPIVDLAVGTTVAVEALARGPEGPFRTPDRLFAAAEAEGLAVELEWACRAAAFRGALAFPMGSLGLFVNVESGMLAAAPPDRIAALVSEVRDRGIPVVLELTERDLLRDPAAILRAVERARRDGWGIALDDVGANPDSLALMPLVRPDVVKLDLRLSQERQDVEIARIASAVSSYAEESGAQILAEGVETEAHRERAIALGATLAQGWLFGRPAPLDEIALESTAPARPWLIAAQSEGMGSSPFQSVGAALPTRIARKSQLVGMSLHLERQAIEQPVPPLLLAAFEEAVHFTPATRRRYGRYAATAPLVLAFGAGMEDRPAPGVRGTRLAASDALVGEWTVVVLGPHFAAALIARDLGDDGPDADRRFEFALTHDRGRVTTAARHLAHRIWASSERGIGPTAASGDSARWRRSSTSSCGVETQVEVRHCAQGPRRPAAKAASSKTTS